MIRLIAILFLVVLLTGCSSLSQQEAESIALGVIRDNVVFFAKDGEERVGFDEYTVEKLESYQEGSDWVIVAHITAHLDGEEKKNDISITLNKKGKLINFNGQDVPTP